MEGFDVGDAVELAAGGAGIVTAPIAKQSLGHVLTLQSGHVVGLSVGLEDVRAADEHSEGFAQLAHQIIRLGSSVIEKRLLVYRH
jgi:hypothetical protein